MAIRRSRFRSAAFLEDELLLCTDFNFYRLDLGTTATEMQMISVSLDCYTDRNSLAKIDSTRVQIQNMKYLVPATDKILYTLSPVDQRIHRWNLNSGAGTGCFVERLTPRARLLYRDHFSGQLYTGDLEGLYTLMSDKLTPFLPEHKELREVSALCATADKLWIGTETKGLLYYDKAKQKVEKVANTNYVHAIRPDGERGVLVATNDGVLVVPDEAPDKYIQLGSKDGLPTNKIEDVLALGDSTLLVATNFGLHEIYRLPATVRPIQKDALQLRAIRVNEALVPFEEIDKLPYTTQQLRFNFQLRSYASRRNIQYRTRLEPLEHEWSESVERSRSYFGLRPGRYTFHLEAIDAYGRKVTHASTTLVIKAALWQRPWFQVLLFVGLVGMIIAYGLRRIRRTRRELAQEKALNRRLAEMEMQALKAQMNPHFIFNALGSIQYFIQTQEVDLADDYLTRFARLMRLYLDSSRETLLPLEQEIALLKNYTDLEMMRFEEQFKVEIQVDDAIAVASSIIPSMILQPFVENAIVHGLSERRDGQGKLSIHFEQPAVDTIRCTISDNGVGRARAAQRGKPGHRSRGMQIVQDKIDTLGAADLLRVNYTIADAEPDHPSFPGTVVTINFKQQEDGYD